MGIALLNPSYAALAWHFCHSSSSKQPGQPPQRWMNKASSTLHAKTSTSQVTPNAPSEDQAISLRDA
ncbi:hypothetical protein QYP02_33470 [Pseudomonas aeruginosa]|nr:hypothetical protein [Pseudomonas aeruginosa]